MSRKTRIVLALLVLVAVFGWQAWQQRQPAPQPQATPSSRIAAVPMRHYGRIAFKPCSLPGFGAAGAIEAQCARFDVPEDRGKPGGRKIALNIAWLPARQEMDAAPDPIFFLAGGPGQAAVESFPIVAPAFEEARKQRHVILVDQRGTGRSNPLACRWDEDVGDQDMALAVRETEACRDRLAKHADLARYTTTDAVRDLDAVRQALGVARVNLVGVSYGTRVAQQYAMRHPQATRSIVLDSPVPNTLVLGNIFARNLDDALALQFGRCTQDRTCRGRLGDPRRELDRLLATLRSQAPLVRYRDPTSGEYRSKHLRPMALAGLVRMYAYQPIAAALLPVLIHEANAGRYEGLAALVEMMLGDLEDMMAMGMQLSVVCSEDGDHIAPSAQDENTVLGHMLTDFLAAQCKVWPKAPPPPDFHRPLATNVPALVLAGEYDPVTPPRYGREIVRSLPAGRLFVLRGQGHSVLGAGCMPKLFAQFLDTGDAKVLDGECLESLAYAPPFTGYNGWEP
jgi:pimeloyl-ACP methyl ester carboxylesterase